MTGKTATISVNPSGMTPGAMNIEAINAKAINSIVEAARQRNASPASEENHAFKSVALLGIRAVLGAMLVMEGITLLGSPDAAMTATNLTTHQWGIMQLVLAWFAITGLGTRVAMVIPVISFVSLAGVSPLWVCITGAALAGALVIAGAGRISLDTVIARMMKRSRRNHNLYPIA